MNKRLKLLLFLASLMLALSVVGCTGTTTTEPADPAMTYSVSNGDGTISATISWDGNGNWTCVTNPVIEGTPCAQKVGSQMHFFHGMTKIAVEQLANGRSTGKLELQSGWTVVTE